MTARRSRKLANAADAPFGDTGETLSPLVAFLTHAALEAGDNMAQAGQDAIQLMTVHSSKGLEFDCVFITGMEEGLFPHENSMNDRDGLEEERRLMYVAITRARKRLYLSHSQSRMLHGQTRFNMKSRFFEELPEDSAEVADAPRPCARTSDAAGMPILLCNQELPYAGSTGARGTFGQKLHARRSPSTACAGAAGVPCQVWRGHCADAGRRGDDARAQINFPRHGTKWLALSVAKLTIVAGVGGVLVFLPQIFLLFFFIALLEDSGYLARVACLMDRLLSKVGLSGKSFIPLLSSFACAIPGIMATRMIGDRRDRLVTILIAPLMSCSARLPVYTLLIAAFIPKRQWLGGLLGLQGLTMAAMYALGIVVAVLVAMILKKTLLRAETPPFLMELPTYKWPSHLVVVRRVWDGGWSFVQGAGTLIVSVTVLVWAAAYYPSNSADVDSELFARQREIRQLLIQTERTSESSALEPAELNRELASLENEIQADRLQNSYLGRCGRLIEPLVRPLGWDWRIGCAVIASFPAREVVVATLGVIYKMGDEQDEQSESLRHTLRKATWDGTQRPVFSIPVALSLMVFFALAPVYFDIGHYATRDELVALANLLLCIHDHFGVSRRTGDLSSRYGDFELVLSHRLQYEPS